MTKGEDLYTISQSYGLTEADLVKLNPEVSGVGYTVHCRGCFAAG